MVGCVQLPLTFMCTFVFIVLSPMTTKYIQPPPPPPTTLDVSLPCTVPQCVGGGGLLPQKSTAPHAPNENHLEERLLDQAQARTPYTPAWGVIRVAYPKAWYWMFNPL